MKILALDSSGFIGKGYDTAHKLFGMRHFSNITLPKSQKLSANLYFFAPLLRLVIAFVWIQSGIVSAFLYPQEGALALLGDVGIGGDWALPTLYFASYLDITVGMMILLNYRIVCLLCFSVIIVVGYIQPPTIGFTPFGCVLKNIPLLMSIFVAIVLERNR